MIFEFSLVGLVFLVIVFAPNILWSRCPSKDYERYSKNENRTLLALERIGEVSVVIFSLFCGVDFNFNVLLLLAFVLMALYELYWVRYFRSSKTMHDMYGSFLAIPAPGATLPVIGFLLLAFVQKIFFFVMSFIVLGIGHICIHLSHKKEIS